MGAKKGDGVTLKVVVGVRDLIWNLPGEETDAQG